MKFVKKLGDGEVTIEGNEVKTKEGALFDPLAEEWTSDFLNEQVLLPYVLVSYKHVYDTSVIWWGWGGGGGGGGGGGVKICLYVFIVLLHVLCSHLLLLAYFHYVLGQISAESLSLSSLLVLLYCHVLFLMDHDYSPITRLIIFSPIVTLIKHVAFKTCIHKLLHFKCKHDNVFIISFSKVKTTCGDTM